MAHEEPEINFRVTLSNSMRRSERIAFEATPDLNETRNVNYKTIDPVHAPGQIYAYANTSSRSFNLSAVKLISRTPEEAARNLTKMWLLRSWTMPRFGKGTLSEQQQMLRDQGQFAVEDIDGDPNTGSGANIAGSELRGQPPTVLYLSAYSREGFRSFQVGGKNGGPGHINHVPVVITNMSFQYPSDIDYIPAEGSNIPMPTILPIDMTLMETHSANEYESFSLDNFRTGRLAGF